MSATITFTAKQAEAYYTITELNTFFTNLATIINGKMDADQANTLTSNLNIGQVKIINMAEGTAATDAVTVRQVRRRKGLA